MRRAMDCLIIKEAAFNCSIGVGSEERKRKQPIVVDCRIGIDISRAVKSSSIADTVDYIRVHDEMKEIAESGEHILIENLAEALARRILEDPKVEEVTLTIKKPRALLGRAALGAIEITRRRDG